jgi:pimeloyl-ACP methyl ester carboxylesterase
LRGLRVCLSALLYDPLSHVGSRFRNDDGTPFSRFLKGMAYRIAFLPVLAALAACAFVYSGTHPPQMCGEMDPSSFGIYYDAVTLRSDDGVRIEAWLVPAVNAHAVLDQREKLLRQRQPAVVLLHDFGNRRQQLLPLVKPLHEAGFVVLVPAMRGCGPSERTGQTFGLREAADVKAAVELLRKRAFVDSKRIALIGVGSGATAALLAASSDPDINTMILDEPSLGINDVVNRYIVPRSRLLEWTRPLCKWTFELAYEVDGEELDMARFHKLMNDRQVLMLDRRRGEVEHASTEQVNQIKTFLELSALDRARARHASASANSGENP